MMEAVCSSETPADFALTTRPYIPEDSTLNNHRCENLMSCINGTSPLIIIQGFSLLDYTWSDNKVRELITVKVLHTSVLNITVVAFKVLPLGSYAPMPAPSPPFKLILELVLLNGLQSCRRITPDVINVIKIPPIQ
jgi:hypothetical protein